MAHQVHSFNFTSLISESRDSFPDMEKLKKQIAVAVLAHCELTEVALGFYAPPDEIKEVKISAAVSDQVRCMWHGHRNRGKLSPPPIPLKIFVLGFGQDSNSTWASIEVLPGVDNWDLD